VVEVQALKVLTLLLRADLMKVSRESRSEWLTAHKLVHMNFLFSKNFKPEEFILLVKTDLLKIFKKSHLP